MVSHALNFDFIVAKYCFGVLGPEELPGIAVQAVADGWDSRSLRQLAGKEEPNFREFRQLFEESVTELGLQLLSTDEAGLAVAKAIAQDVLNGSLGPYEGAKQIWSDVYVRNQELKSLRTFVGSVCECDEDPDNRDAYLRDIVEQCRSLLGR